MSQTAYNIEAARAFAGMLAEFENTTKASISRANEETSAVAPGTAVVAGTDGETQYLLPVDANSVFFGATVHKHGTQDPTDDGFAEGETTEILTRGRIWVECESGCAVGDAAYWVHPAGTAGAWRNDATNAVAFAGHWMTAAGAGELAILEINLP